ncbi:MAG: hypothetical protein JSS30_02330 [Verrucomicrobia bacterium]|nr:hypothetical protein [Verrucomicrobiota bacterium]
MVKATNLINSLTSSLNTAGLCTIFGWANPKAAAAGQLANTVAGVALNPIKNLFWIPSQANQKTFTLKQIIVNGALLVGAAAATAYAANYFGRQIDPNYNYIDLIWPQFKLSAAIGIGVGLTELIVTSQYSAPPTEKETKETPPKTIPLVVTPFIQDSLFGAAVFAGAAALLGINVSRFLVPVGFTYALAQETYRESLRKKEENAAQEAQTVAKN